MRFESKRDGGSCLLGHVVHWITLYGIAGRNNNKSYSVWGNCIEEKRGKKYNIKKKIKKKERYIK